MTKIWYVNEKRSLGSNVTDITSGNDSYLSNYIIGKDGRNVQQPINWLACLHHLLCKRRKQDSFEESDRHRHIQVRLLLSICLFQWWDRRVMRLYDHNGRRIPWDHLLFPKNDCRNITVYNGCPWMYPNDQAVNNSKPCSSERFAIRTWSKIVSMAGSHSLLSFRNSSLCGGFMRLFHCDFLRAALIKFKAAPVSIKGTIVSINVGSVSTATMIYMCCRRTALHCCSISAASVPCYMTR